MCLVAMVPSGIIKYLFFPFEDSVVIFNCMCLCARERYMHAQEGRDAQRSGGSDLPGAIGRGSCELPDLHAKN